jgi:hypothetical protein
MASVSRNIDLRFVELQERSLTQNIRAEVDPSDRLEVNVIFTDKEGTLAALRTAGSLAHSLGAHINLVVSQVVPLAFPLVRPPVSVPFTERRLLNLASQGAQGSLETVIQLYLCRDKRQCLLKALKPHSLVVIGGRRRWWPNEESRLARLLRSKGHQVLLAPLR